MVTSEYVMFKNNDSMFFNHKLLLYLNSLTNKKTKKRLLFEMKNLNKKTKTQVKKSKDLRQLLISFKHLQNSKYSSLIIKKKLLINYKAKKRT